MLFGVIERQKVQVGDQVSIVIEISGATDVGHVPFHVTMNPQVLQFEYGEEGNFLSSDGRQTAFFAAATSDAAVVVVGLSRIRQGDGIRGGGDLCVLHFIAVGPGNAGLGFARARFGIPATASFRRSSGAQFWWCAETFRQRAATSRGAGWPSSGHPSVECPERRP